MKIRFHERTTRRAFLAATAFAGAAHGEFRAKGQYYFVEDRASMQSLSRNAGRIGLLCPAWYAFDREGNLAADIGPVTRQIVMRNRMRVVPLVVNKGFEAAAARAVLAEPRQWDRAIAAMVSAVEKQGHAGYEMDFENLHAADRDAYSGFIAALARELKKRGRTLSVAVPAPLLPAQPGSDHQPAPGAAGFDYRELARHADWISLMAYDEHTQPGQPGPIASHAWVEACLAHLLAAMPPRKLKLGIPFYHRRWSARGVQEGSYAEAELLANAYGVRMDLRRREREIHFKFNGAQGDEIVWLHGASSLKARLELGSQYGLLGFAAWRLGQEDPDFWNALPGGQA